MGRRKIEIKAIKDDRNRSVTFLKRKGGLFKKAHELAVLCSVDVAVIIFGHNKKLYEFSSCDMRETLGRYQYFGPPHEHKGPEDFTGKREADDEEDDETTPAPEDLPPRSRTHSVVPPHMPNQPGFQHINHAPSASPPIANGVAFAPRRGTPQPQVISRPTSRNHIRRVSANIAPQHHATPPPPQNGFAYMPNPSIYNPNAAASMNQHAPRPGQYPHFAHPQAGPQMQPPPQQLQQHPLPPQPMPPRQPHPQQHMAPQPHGLPQMGLSQAHPPVPQMAQVYLPDQARAAMPPAFAEPPQPRPVTLPDTSSADQISIQPKFDGGHSSKSRSIFTPIDDRGSVLARHFGVVPHVCESPRTDPTVKAESLQNESSGEAKLSSVSVPPAASSAAAAAPVSAPVRSKSIPASSESKPPTRTNSSTAAGRPKLTVQIPSENSDRGSATGESSARDSAGNKTQTPAKGNSDTNPPGVVLPPPSPSAGAILSAGAQGPPNPFARPPPPGTTAGAAQNSTAYANNNNIETPVSALPSRFVSDALLPSPSSFFPEWGFGRTGPDSNMLPSPLTFPTPSAQTGPSFSREDESDKKRKNDETGPNSEAASKRVKT
ncbi:hypothetical protein MPDQ_004250 [Monascus purpureus]|uniref:MADS-box domain-containing protein n=1 Tax=Monascus purpureus TaxID=5098 RepID=A0A507QY39_MONPU|nr:hypothetical protein MPDQ_004250 [Monascus purpureus]